LIKLRRPSLAWFLTLIIATTNSLVLGTMSPAVAQEAVPAEAPATPVHLDLGSTEASLAANLGQAASIHIEMGGVATPITAGSMVTPAQYVAIQQVMQTGTQSLMLNSLGAAQSGTFAMHETLAGMIGNLSIPTGVTALHDAASASLVNLTGNFVNSGSYYAYTSNVAVAAASLAAQNITNNQNAILSTILPATLQSSLNPALTSLTLNLSAINNIVNAGTISSSANLNLYAGGSITNALPPGATGMNPVMQAMQNLNITAMSGMVQNSGVMAAMLGNINVQTAQMANLTVNNINGIMQAMNGAINIRDSLSMAKVNTMLTGGDYLAEQLNIYSGSGTALVDAANISAITNITAGAAHMRSTGDSLKLGNLNLSGDPTFFNTGDIQITGDINVGEALSIVAGGDIYIPDGSTVNFITAGAGLQGFDINIIAGANITSGTGSTGSVSGSPPAIGAATSAVTIDGASVSGGNIDFSESPGISIFTCGGCVGGNFTFAAYAGTGVGSDGGHIILPGFIGTGGDVTIVAGANDSTAYVNVAGNSITDAVNLGDVVVGNNILIASTQPVSSSGQPVIFGTNGAITPISISPLINNSITAGTTLKPTDIYLAGQLDSTSSVRVLAGRNLETQAVTSLGPIVLVSQQGDMTVTSPVQGAGVALISGN
jgi:hypothetical protein